MIETVYSSEKGEGGHRGTEVGGSSHARGKAKAQLISNEKLGLDSE